MALVDLKNTGDAARTDMEAADKTPEYPWGLNVTLNKETLDKLGKSITDFAIGSEHTVAVVMKVQDLSKNVSENYDSESVGLVITQMDLGEVKSDAARASKIFGEAK